jgi:hypothetical protein
VAVAAAFAFHVAAVVASATGARIIAAQRRRQAADGAAALHQQQQRQQQQRAALFGRHARIVPVYDDGVGDPELIDGLYPEHAGCAGRLQRWYSTLAMSALPATVQTMCACLATVVGIELAAALTLGCSLQGASREARETVDAVSCVVGTYGAIL